MNIHILSGIFYKVLYESSTHVYVQDQIGNRKRFSLAYFKTHATLVGPSPKINKPPTNINWEEAFEPEINT